MSDLFNDVQLSSDEQIQGAMLSTVQVASIQNLISDYAEEVVRTTLNASDPDAFIKIAYAKGKLEVLRYLIERSNSLTNQQYQES